ncbi:hypothetical protein N0A02_30320 [Paraburkholderia acidicola]|uniref:Uncharacterized protein n=1 Tax=Paraburkholderia acidicola TaxID=1912599 RepID=A0ABV1LWX0_9BURK
MFVSTRDFVDYMVVFDQPILNLVVWAVAAPKVRQDAIAASDNSAYRERQFLLQVGVMLSGMPARPTGRDYQYRRHGPHTTALTQRSLQMHAVLSRHDLQELICTALPSPS